MRVILNYEREVKKMSNLVLAIIGVGMILGLCFTITIVNAFIEVEKDEIEMCKRN